MAAGRQPLITARCALLRRPLDQVGAMLMTGIMTILVALGSGGLLRALELDSTLALGGAVGIAAPFLVFSILQSRFRHRLQVFVDGVAIPSPAKERIALPETLALTSIAVWLHWDDLVSARERF